MTLYTSTVVVPSHRAGAVRRTAVNVLYAVGLPFLLLVLWGIWSTVAPATPRIARVCRSFEPLGSPCDGGTAGADMVDPSSHQP